MRTIAAALLITGLVLGGTDVAAAAKKHAPACAKQVKKHRQQHRRACELDAPLHIHPRSGDKPKGGSHGLSNQGGAGSDYEQYLPWRNGERLFVYQGNNSTGTHSINYWTGGVHVGLYTHNGWDFGMSYGETVYAAVNGKVRRAVGGCRGDIGGNLCNGGYGNTIQIQAPDGTCSRYEHLSAIRVKVGDVVDRYTPIGAVGNSGASYGTHLHYQREVCGPNGVGSGYSLPSTFVDAGVPSGGHYVTSGNRPLGNTPVRVCPADCNITGAAAGVDARSGPGTDAPTTSHLANGAAVHLTCQVRSSSQVGGSYIWDRLDDGNYVPDYYVNSPSVNAYSPGVSQCNNAPGRSIAMRGNSGYTLDGWGNLHPVGAAPAIANDANDGRWWPSWDIARAVVLRPNGTSGYVLDGWGAAHPFGGASTLANGPYWQGWDIARSLALTPSGDGAYLLDGWGGVHALGNAPAVTTNAYWKGWDIARSIAVRPDGTSGYVLDGYGGIHGFGGAPDIPAPAYWKGWDIARAIALRPDGVSGYVLDGYGAVHAFGGAPAASVTRYTPGSEDAAGLSLTASGNGGWVVFTDGKVAQFGDAPAVTVR